MLGFLKRDRYEVYKTARRKGLSHYEKEHRTRSMLYFKRAAQVCPERAGELAQFFYDRHEYKQACFFYDTRLRAGGADKRDYRHAMKAYEKRAAMYDEQNKHAKHQRCRAQAMAYRASIAKYFDGPPLYPQTPLGSEHLLEPGPVPQIDAAGVLGAAGEDLTGITRRPSMLS